jgi:class 3 adenylate cyclase
MTEPIRVVVADDHAVVRQGLKLFLDVQDDIVVAGEAVDGDDAVERAKELRPDVILMDLMMPGTDGVQATRTVRAACPETKVLVLTSYADDDKVVAVVRAGAAGYLMKDASPEEVAEAIRTVYRGDPLLHPDVTRRLMRQLAEPTPHVTIPEGTVTILFTDIEASTELFSRLGDEGARAVFREHDRILREAVRRHGGVEVKHQGDGMMIAFSSARRALRSAVEIQRALAERNASGTEEAIRVRIGINTGEVIAEDDDYFGTSVVTAARIAGAARGGQILISEATKGILGSGAGDVRLVSVGERELRGLPGPCRIHAAIWDG